MINRNVTLDKLKELGIECPYNDLVENHWGYCDLIEASIPHSAEEWHGLSYNDGIYNIIVEKFIDQNGKELAETVTTAGKEESSPKVIPAYEYRAISARSFISTRTVMRSRPLKRRRTPKPPM